MFQRTRRRESETTHVEAEEVEGGSCPPVEDLLEGGQTLEVEVSGCALCLLRLGRGRGDGLGCRGSVPGLFAKVHGYGRVLGEGGLEGNQAEAQAEAAVVVAAPSLVVDVVVDGEDETCGGEDGCSVAPAFPRLLPSCLSGEVLCKCVLRKCGSVLYVICHVVASYVIQHRPRSPTNRCQRKTTKVPTNAETTLKRGEASGADPVLLCHVMLCRAVQRCVAGVSGWASSAAAQPAAAAQAQAQAEENSAKRAVHPSHPPAATQRSVPRLFTR